MQVAALMKLMSVQPFQTLEFIAPHWTGCNPLPMMIALSERSKPYGSMVKKLSFESTKILIVRTYIVGYFLKR